MPVLKQLSHLPVIVDPSHGTGHWELVGAVLARPPWRPGPMA